MKTSKLIMGCLATLGLTAIAGTILAQDDAERDAIAERLKPVGELCVQGEDCGSASSSAGAGDSASSGGGGDIDGAGIYNNVCMACHETGAAGAPIRGDEAAWADRVEKGFTTLLDHSMNGFNAMPARGGNPNLSDAEMRAVTAYMVEPVMDVPEQGGGEEAATEEAPAEEGNAEAASSEESTDSATDATAQDDATSAEEGTDSATDAAAQDDATTDATTEEASADAAGGEPSHAGIDGEAVFNQICMACHMTGAAGAPVRGEADQWAPRLEKGIETLYDHSINGFNAMPAKGGNPSLSDDEVKAATDYLVAPVQ